MGGASRKKKEITVLLNQILGTSIAWHKLSMDELEQLVELFTHPEELYEKLKTSDSEKNTEDFSKVREVLRKTAVKVGIKLLDEWEGPIISYLKELLKK